MDIKFNPAGPYAPANKLAEVSLELPEYGFYVTGLTLWKGKNGDGQYVTFPAREYQKNGKTEYFDYIRGIDGIEAVKKLKAEIVNAWLDSQR
jgi:hypothetical protein